LKLVLLSLATVVVATALVWIAKRTISLRSREAHQPHALAVEGTHEQMLADSRRAARDLSAVLADTGAHLKAGLTTQEVNDFVVAQLRRRNLIPVMRGFNGYPSDSNVSVNEEVLHAPPSARTLGSGDIVKIQTSARVEHAFANQGWSFLVGEGSAEGQRIIAAAHGALLKALTVIRDGSRTGDVGHAIQSEVEAAGFAVVRDYIGYAMGHRMMEGPQLPGYGRAGTGARLRVGQILNVHVIAKAGDFDVKVTSNDWTVTGEPGELSALFTAMVLVQRDHGEVLSSVQIPTM
jgi:methionyl aminopeptidase